jgi:hypothetical protein
LKISQVAKNWLLYYFICSHPKTFGHSELEKGENNVGNGKRSWKKNTFLTQYRLTPSTQWAEKRKYWTLKIY